MKTFRFLKVEVVFTAVSLPSIILLERNGGFAGKAPDVVRLAGLEILEAMDRVRWVLEKFTNADEDGGAL